MDSEKNRELEAQLRKASEAFGTIMKTMAFPVIVSSLKDGRILFANDIANEVIIDHKAVQSGVDVISFWKNKEERIKFFRKILKDKKLENYKVNLINKEGVHIETLVSSSLIEFEGKQAVFTFFNYMTEQIKTEIALKESEEKYNKLFNTMNDGACLIEGVFNKEGNLIDGIYLDANKKYSEFINQEPGSFFGKKVSEILPGTEKEWWETFEPVILKGEAVHFEMYNEPSHRWYRVNAYRPKAKTFAAIFSDVTSVKESEQQLKEAITTKDKFFSIISHDLRSPFNSLLGFSDLLLDALEDKDYKNLEIYAREVHKISTNTNTLVNNLLTWARIQTNRISFNPVNLNLLEQTNIVIEQNICSLEEKQIGLVVDIPGPVAVEADKDMLQTITRNLISNAVKFTPKDGEIKIQAWETESFISWSISDNGLGIDPEIQKKLFKVGESISTKGTEREMGTGLGLILCQEFVNLHKGNIRIESEPNMGTTVVVELPA